MFYEMKQRKEEIEFFEIYKETDELLLDEKT